MNIVRTYYSGYAETALWVEYRGMRKLIPFTSLWYGPEHGCVFSTADPEMQAAIEATKQYRRGLVKLRSVSQPQDVAMSPEKVKTDVREYPNVKKVQQAANVLIDEYGVAECDCENKAAILAVATRIGVAFPNLK